VYEGPAAKRATEEEYRMAPLTGESWGGH
jgi:hypothetical protein